MQTDRKKTLKNEHNWCTLWRIVASNCRITWIYIICTRKYEDIKNTKQTTYVYELKVFSYTCKRLEVHITSAPWAMVHQSEWILSACSGQSTLGGPLVSKGG